MASKIATCFVCWNLSIGNNGLKVSVSSRQMEQNSRRLTFIYIAKYESYKSHVDVFFVNLANYERTCFSWEAIPIIEPKIITNDKSVKWTS